MLAQVVRLLPLTFDQVLILFWIAASLVVAVLPHPAAESRTAIFLRMIGRISLLRFADSPGTLHFPSQRQPDPDDDSQAVRKIAAAIDGIPAAPEEHPVDTAARLLRGLPRAQRLGNIVMLALLASALAGCLSPGDVLKGLVQLDKLSSGADKLYGQCMQQAGLVAPVAEKEQVPAACRPARRCIDFTAEVATAADQAIADAVSIDPWMRGKAATAYKQGFPVAGQLCKVAGVAL